MRSGFFSRCNPALTLIGHDCVPAARQAIAAMKVAIAAECLCRVAKTLFLYALAPAATVWRPSHSGQKQPGYP